MGWPLFSKGQGRLDAQAQAEVEAHVAGCPDCCRVLSAVPDDTLIETLRAGSTLPPPPPPAVGVASVPESELPPALRDHPRYRILRVLGSGGMGVVYQAVHRLMERPVALKVIHPHVLEHPLAVERFRREVKAAARLTHPNIVTAYDAEQAGNLHFLVMEYVEGTSLAQLVHQRGPLPVPLACDYARQAALGLEHAMEQGMVHRDVKPQNLMLTAGGAVKILDFGLARLARHDEPALPPAGAGPVPRHGPTLTAASSMLGTLEYMAPEQAESAGSVDIRADIYSLGRTLEFLLSGKSPSPAAGAPAPGATTVDESNWRAPVIPWRLATILRRMTAADPAARYQTPAEVARALAPWSAPASKLSGRPWAGRVRRYGIPLVLGLVLVGLVCAWAIARKQPAAPARSTETTPVAQGRAPAAPVPTDRRRLLVILPEEFEPDDYQDLLRSTKDRFTLEIASTSAEPCRPVAWKPGGPQFRPSRDLSAGPVDPGAYGAVVFVGGNIFMYKHAAAPLAPVVWKLVSDARARGMPVVALGQGIRVLAAMDELGDTRLALADEKYRTMFPGHRQWSTEPVVVDGRILTAADPAAVQALVDRLSEILSK